MGLQKQYNQRFLDKLPIMTKMFYKFRQIYKESIILLPNPKNDDNLLKQTQNNTFLEHDIFHGN